MVPYVGVGVLVVTLVLTGFFTTVSRVSLLILKGLHVYFLPDDLDKADGDSTAGNGPEKEEEAAEKMKRKGGKRKKDRVLFNEAGAQILRLRLVNSQVETRKYFHEYDEAVIYTCLGITSVVVREILEVISGTGVANRHGWSAALAPDDRITFMVNIFAIYKLIRVLAKVGYDPQLNRNSDKVYKWSAGIVGFAAATALITLVPPSLVDFGIDDAVADARISASIFLRKKGVEVPEELPISTTTVKLLLALVAGICSGLLFGPALRDVKSFWVATDQLEWNISLLKRSRFVRPMLNISVILPLVISLLWVKPMSEVFVRSPNEMKSELEGVQECRDSEEAGVEGFLPFPRELTQPEYKNPACAAVSGVRESSIQKGGVRPRHGPGGTKGEGTESVNLNSLSNLPGWNSVEKDAGILKRVFMWRQYDWAASFGVAESTFKIIRVWALLLAGLFHVCLLRVNIQTYCDGAALMWYESLHRSKDQNTEVIKARIFVFNYFTCRVAVQSLVPGVLVLLTIGLARTRGSLLDGLVQEGSFFFAPSFVRAAAHFCCWWMVFTPACQTWATLALFRVGLLTNIA